MALDYSIISQAPEIRAIVQDGFLEREIRDGLLPRMLYRSEAVPREWMANVGDRQIFTADGVPEPDCSPAQPGVDPTSEEVSKEQWEAQMQEYTGTFPTAMKNSIVAIANLFLVQGKNCGIKAALSIDTNCRDRMHNRAESGRTVCDGTQVSSTSLIVKRLNGFTRARRPDLAGGAPVQYAPVSSSNPLPITIIHGGVPVSKNVIAFTPTISGDEFGPGTLTLDAASGGVTDRDPIIAVDASYTSYVGGGNSIDALGPTDVPTMDDIHAVVSNFRTDNVPEHPDGFFHAHVDAVTEVKLLADPAIKQLLTALPEHYMAKQAAMGVLGGVVFLRNTRAPTQATVISSAPGAAVAHDGLSYSTRDPFAPELFTLGSKTTGIPVHRTLFTALGGLMEYYLPMADLITEAGINGKIVEPQITNNGIIVDCERVRIVLRAAMNLTLDKVDTTYQFLGDWPARTDGATGSPVRFKRFACLASA